MKVSFVMVTPNKAADLLTRNNKNRPINDERVRLLMEEYRNGRWNAAVGQGIMVNRFGELTNGQHRLTMVVRLNEPVEMLFISDVEEDTFWLVDQSVGSRNFGQRLGLDGYKESATLSAAATVFILAQRSCVEKEPLSFNSATPSEADRLALIEKTPRLVDWTTEVRALYKKNKFAPPATVAAWATLAEQEISAPGVALLHTFVEKLHTLDMCPSNGTIASARKAVMCCDTSKAGRARALLILTRAWRAFAAGEEMVVFRIDEKAAWIQMPKKVTR